MEYIIGFVFLAVVIWVFFLRSAGSAKGEAIGSEFNLASEKVGATLGELIREVSKAEPEKLSDQQFRHLVERAADDFSRYANVTYVVSSKLNQRAGRATRPQSEFLAAATAEFATAIGAAIELRDVTSLRQVMDKYGIKSVSP